MLAALAVLLIATAAAHAAVATFASVVGVRHRPELVEVVLGGRCGGGRSGARWHRVAAHHRGQRLAVPLAEQAGVREGGGSTRATG
jgi:hypothetical protein